MSVTYNKVTYIEAAEQIACGFYLHIQPSYKCVQFHETEHKLVVKQLMGEKCIGLKHAYFILIRFAFLIAVISKKTLQSENILFIMALLFLKPSHNSLGGIYLMFTFNITKEMRSNVLGILQIYNKQQYLLETLGWSI